MTAIRVTEPSGSNGAIQFANNGVFDTDSGLIFNTTTQRLGVGTAAPDTLLHVAGQTTVGTAATDLHAVTGSLSVSVGLTGSLTHLTDGTSFLIAGSNMTLTTGSSGAVTVASTAGSTIGAAEDASYVDGLFTDFTSVTPIGTAVDRFNEVLKSLAPAPAPTLDDVDHNEASVAAKLSFGTSNVLGGYTSVATAAGLAAVDVNGTYTSTTTNNNMRIGVFDATNVVVGDLNEDIAADTHSNAQVNHPANSFGNSDQGTLKLEVNGSVVHTIDLTDGATGAGASGAGTGSHLNGNSSGFINLSAATTAKFSDASVLDLFKHRTGKFQVGTADQRNGWNYARVIHTVGGSDTNTNYIEWVNDNDANALASAGSAFDTLVMTGELNLSGVRYHTGGTAKYRVRVTNAYRNIYTTSNMTFTVTAVSIPAQAVSAISGGDDETKVLHVTGTATVNSTSILNSSLSAAINVPHPLKANLSNSGTQTIAGILVYNVANNSTTTTETFRRENHRLISGSYDAQADATDAGSTWNSSKHMSGSNTGHTDGLMFYNKRLYAPIQGANAGDFDGIANGPADNVDYSGITTGVRTFYRSFTNTSGGSATNFNLTIQGSSTIVSQSTALTATKIHVLVKLPLTSAASSSGWMDLALAFATGQVTDGAGCLVGTLDSTLNATNEVTFGTESVGNTERVLLKIEAAASWTGHVSQVSVSWP